MADDNTQDNAQDEKYKGTGKFVSAIGRGTVETVAVGGTATVVGGVVGNAVGKSRMKKFIAGEGHDEAIGKYVKAFEKQAEKIKAADPTIKDVHFDKAKAEEALGQSFKEVAEGLRNNPEAAKLAKGISGAAHGLVYAGVAAITLGTIAALHGMYKGAKSASDGKKQYEELKVNANALEGRAQIAAAAASQSAPAVG